MKSILAICTAGIVLVLSDVIRMAANEGLVPKCDFIEVEIGPHTVQSVTVRLRK